MQVYNVDIFNSSTLELVAHDTVDKLSIEYKYDYISPDNNTIVLKDNKNISIGNLIWIYDYTVSPGATFYNPYNYLGVVKEIEHTDKKGVIEVTYADYAYEMFNQELLFDTSLQGQAAGTTLQGVLEQYFNALFVNNSDTSMVITNIDTVSSGGEPIYNFYLGIGEMDGGKKRAIVKFYDDLLIEAFKRYGITLTVVFNGYDKSLMIFIGQVSQDNLPWLENDTTIIEADLPTVISKSIVIKNPLEGTTNKLIVYNKDNFSTTRTYYLHPNGSYNTTNNNRITPVIQEVAAVSVPSDSTFANEAGKQAGNTFSKSENENLIELEVLENDTLINPATMAVGQAVKIYSGGVEYSTILSGYKVGLTTTLIFGGIRLELTKIIKQ